MRSKRTMGPMGLVMEWIRLMSGSGSGNGNGHGAARLAWVMLLALGVLSGCALTPPAPLTSEAEVRAKRGEPTRIWDDPEGTRTLEYATQPFGTTCWMYTIDAEGKVVAQFDALSQEHRNRVKPGMSPDEVRRLLGQERSIQRYSLSGEEVWDWNVSRVGMGVSSAFFNVHFVDGKVTRTSMSYDYPDERWQFGIGFGRGVHPHWGFGWGWPYYYRPWPYHYW